VRVVVFRSLVLPEAHLVRSFLEGHGVDAWIAGEHLRSVLGMIAVPDAELEVWVHRDDADEARGLLSKILSQDERGRLSIAEPGPGEGLLSLLDQSPRDDPERCVMCDAEWEPGFDMCWQCEHELGA